MTFTRKTDNVDDVMAEDVNELQEAIEDLQAAESPNTYQVSAIVASNNLTVALKNSAGDDPTPEASVRVPIGDTVYTIDDALFVTAAAATNWFDSGGAGLATLPVDYFVYLGYNATDGVTIGFARVPFGRVYSDFSTTSTDETFCRISTITNAAAADPYTVIGRFTATLSAGAGYTWTVPTFTPATLIHQPIYETRKLTYVPVGITADSMTFTITDTTTAEYQIMQNRCKLNLNVTGTTGGTAGSIIRVSPPIAKVGSAEEAPARARDATGGVIPVGMGSISTAGIGVLKSDNSNFGLGTGRIIRTTTIYDIK
jgi:hypothetical protein